MSVFDQMSSSSVVQGTRTVQVQPFSIAEVQYSFKDTAIFPRNVNQYSDKYMQVAPVGFSVPNPTTFKGNFHQADAFYSSPTVKSTNSASKRCNK